LGVMFYRMTTGALPHQGESARDTLTRRLTEPPAPLSVSAPDAMFPEGLQSVVERVLARRPAERYPTAGAFGTALVELFTGPLEIATLPTVRLDTATAPVPVPVPSRRGTALAVGGVIVAAAIVALVVLRPTLGNSGNVLINDPIAPAPPPAVIPPPAAVLPPPASTVRDTGRSTTQGPRQGGLKTVNPPPESLRVAPPPPSPMPATPAPTSADVDALDPVEETRRDADRAKAVQYYNRDDADAVVRARAAFVAANAFFLDKQYAEAETWVDRAIAMNRTTPASPERTVRETRYRNWRINNRQMMTSDTTGP
jgi:hypothetical protein